MRTKVLLMGRSAAGKTSMRSIIFANLVAKQTDRMKPTLDVEHSSVRFMGDLVLNIWDCGGQEMFQESYFEAERESIFRDVAVLIYVFDVRSPEQEKDLKDYSRCIEAIRRHGSRSKVFCLVHKMDKIPPESKDIAFQGKREAILERSEGFDTQCFATSIWDETLYKAWSAIVVALVPNTERLGAALQQLADACDASEVVLFESATFLVVSSCTRRAHVDGHRFEKMSNIVKQLKLSCMSARTLLHGLQIANSRFRAYLSPLTPTTIVMIVTPRPGASVGLCMLNVAVAQPQFNRLLDATESGAVPDVAIGGAAHPAAAASSMQLLDQAAGTSTSALSVPGAADLDDVMPAVAGASLPTERLADATGNAPSTVDDGDILA